MPLWLAEEGNGQRIGWTLATYELAAAGGACSTWRSLHASAQDASYQ